MRYSIKNRFNLALAVFVAALLSAAAALMYLSGKVDRSTAHLQECIGELSDEYEDSLEGLKNWEMTHLMGSNLQTIQVLEERYLRTHKVSVLKEALEKLLLVKKWNSDELKRWNPGKHKQSDEGSAHISNHRFLQVEITEYETLLRFIIANSDSVTEEEQSNPSGEKSLVRIKELQEQAEKIWRRANACEKYVRERSTYLRSRIEVVQRNTEEMSAAVSINNRSRAWIMWGLICLLLMLAGIGGLFVRRVLLAPILSLTAVARRIGEGNYGITCVPPNSRELGGLGETVNEMSLRIERDIAARKMSEESLNRKTQQLETSQRLQKMIFDNSPVGMMMINSERKIIEINPAALAIVGRKREEIINHICHKFVCPANVHSCPVLDRGEIVDVSEKIALGANGEEIPILKSVVSLEIDGETMLLEAFTDITGRKKIQDNILKAKEDAEQAKEGLSEKMRELERFHRLTIGREMRIIDLKKEVNRLCEKAGEENRYDPSFAADGAAGGVKSAGVSEV